MLLLFALIAGSSSSWATEKSYTITFKDTGTNSDSSTKITTISDIISDGATYVSSISDPTNVYNARSGRGIKLGTSSKAGSLTLNLAEAVTPTKITFNARQYKENETSITVNGKEVTELTGDFDEYTINYDGSTEVSSIAISTPSKRAYITQVTVYYEGSGSDPDPVAVTGVTVDPTEWEMEIGDTKALTATVLPAEATNKNVTWKSSDDGVATVSAAGVVTAVAAGTATITVTTADGGKTATCAITVNEAAPEPAAGPVALTFDFTDPGWGFPENYDEDEKSYTNNGYTFTLGASSNGGHKAYIVSSSIVSLIFGKKDATLTFPAFDFNVSKIIVYGYSAASGKTTFNIYVGDDAVSTEVTGCKTSQTFDIAAEKQAVGTIYTLKVTNDNNCQISKIEIFGYISAEIGSAGYATFAAPVAVDFSATSVEVFTAAVSGSSVVLTSVESKKVPANTAVVLKGATATGTVIESAEALTGNELKVSDGTVKGDGSIYVLAKVDDNVRFYKLKNDSPVPAGKAYLQVDGTNVPEFLDFEENTTGIDAVRGQKEEVRGEFYNLAGQRVAQPTKGLYIVNGKKIVIK